jgi:chemotaxis protein CheD
MRYNVGIGEFKVSRTGSDEIKTYALGSCVSVIVYDPQNTVAGLIHIALPDSKVNADKAKRLPGYFVDTGMPVFLETFAKAGGVLGRSKIKLAGGASIMDENKTFDIGRRNVIAIKRFLWKSGLGVVREDVGGKISRTVSIVVSDGSVLISNSKETWTI